MNKIKAVIFDWSGTLSDDVALCLDADNRLLARHDRPPITMHEFIRYYTTPDLVGFYEREFGLRFSSQEELHREYEEAMRAAVKNKAFEPEKYFCVPEGEEEKRKYWRKLVDPRLDFYPK